MHLKVKELGSPHNLQIFVCLKSILYSKDVIEAQCLRFLVTFDIISLCIREILGEGGENKLNFHVYYYIIASW